MKVAFILISLAVLAVSSSSAGLAEKVSEDDNFVVYRIPVRALTDLQTEATGHHEGYELSPSYGRSSSKSSSHSKSSSSSTGTGKGKGYGEGSMSKGHGEGYGGSSHGYGSGGSGYGSGGHGYGSGGHGYGSGGQGYGSGGSGYGSGGQGYGSGGQGYGSGGHGYGSGGSGGSGYGGSYRAAQSELSPGYRSGQQAFNVNEFTRTLNQGMGQAAFTSPSYRNNRFLPQASIIIPKAYAFRHNGFGLPGF